MIDTAIKDGKNLFAFLTKSQIQGFVDSAHNYGLKVALAGSLRENDLPTVHNLGADFAGLRGAACTMSDRINGQITRERVQKLVKIVRASEKL